MYVTDMFNERIEEFTPNGSGGYTYDREWGLRGDTAGTMNYPRLPCVDPQTGNLIVANTDSSTAVAWNVSVNPPREVWAYGALKTPYGLACSSTGTIYVADSNDSDVVALTSAGGLLGTMGSAEHMGFVRGIWVDSTDGTVWVDASTTGDVYHFAQWSDGGAFLGSFDVNSSIPSAGVFGISGNADYLYIALSSANQVAEYTRSGTLLGTFGGAGSKVGQMRTPQGLAFGPDGKLYVVEENNNRVSQWTVPPAPVSPKSYVATLGGPGHAGMYPSGAEVVPSGARTPATSWSPIPAMIASLSTPQAERWSGRRTHLRSLTRVASLGAAPTRVIPSSSSRATWVSTRPGTSMSQTTATAASWC